MRVRKEGGRVEGAGWGMEKVGQRGKEGRRDRGAGEEGGGREGGRWMGG